MKTVLMLRHAKSDWDNPSLADFERPLNKRGLNDAPLVGDVLMAYNHVPDKILASPAKRAKATAELVAEACGYNKKLIQWEDSFYGADSFDLIAALKRLSEGVQRVMIVGHNPTMEETITELCLGQDLAEPFIRMPTAALACLSFDIEMWADLEGGDAILEWLVIPKLLKALDE